MRWGRFSRTKSLQQNTNSLIARDAHEKEEAAADFGEAQSTEQRKKKTRANEQDFTSQLGVVTCKRLLWLRHFLRPREIAAGTAHSSLLLKLQDTRTATPCFSLLSHTKPKLTTRLLCGGPHILHGSAHERRPTGCSVYLGAFRIGANAGQVIFLSGKSLLSRCSSSKNIVDRQSIIGRPVIHGCLQERMVTASWLTQALACSEAHESEIVS